MNFEWRLYTCRHRRATFSDSEKANCHREPRRRPRLVGDEGGAWRSHRICSTSGQDCFAALAMTQGSPAFRVYPRTQTPWSLRDKWRRCALFLGKEQPGSSRGGAKRRRGDLAGFAVQACEAASRSLPCRRSRWNRGAKRGGSQRPRSFGCSLAGAERRSNLFRKAPCRPERLLRCARNDPRISSI